MAAGGAGGVDRGDDDDLPPPPGALCVVLPEVCLELEQDKRPPGALCVGSSRKSRCG